MELKIGDKFTSNLYTYQPMGDIFTVVGFEKGFIKGTCDDGNRSFTDDYVWNFKPNEVKPLKEEKEQMNYEVGKWYGWNGGECPVHPETEVEVIVDFQRQPRHPSNSLHDNFKSYVGIAKTFLWGPETFPIVAFKVIKEHVEPREFWVLLSHQKGISSEIHNTKEKALGKMNDTDELIKVRELIEGED